MTEANKENDQDPAQVSDETLEEKKPNEITGLTDKELVKNITLLQYYTAGIVFIKQIELSVPHLINLLASNTKGEVVEAMHFFVVAYRFEMECAMVLIKSLKKDWSKIYGAQSLGQRHL